MGGGGTFGHKTDLFDTSSRNGQTDLFDTRKRRASVMATPDRRYDRYDTHAHSPPPQKRKQQHTYSPNLDLGGMLYPDRISNQKFRTIQDTLKDQGRRIQELIKDASAREETLSDRGKEISKCRAQIESLDKQVGHLDLQNRRLKDDKQRQEKAAEHTLKQHREVKEKLQSLVKEKDGYLGIGTKAVKEKTELAKRVESENVLLRSTITERDGTISKLNEQIWRLAKSSGEELTHERLEAQATMTLGMMNGLRDDVRAKDMTITELETQVEEMSVVLKEGYAAKVALQREVENGKREVARQKEIAERATKRAQRAREVAEQQEELIGRILEENGKLVREV